MSCKCTHAGARAVDAKRTPRVLVPQPRGPCGLEPYERARKPRLFKVPARPKTISVVRAVYRAVMPCGRCVAVVLIAVSSLTLNQKGLSKLCTRTI